MTETLTRIYETQESTEIQTETDSETRETPERIPFHAYPFVEDFLENNSMDEKSFVNINKFFNIVERNTLKEVGQIFDGVSYDYNDFLESFNDRKPNVVTKLFLAINELTSTGNKDKLEKIKLFFQDAYNKFIKEKTTQSLEETTEESLDTEQQVNTERQQVNTERQQVNTERQQVNTERQHEYNDYKEIADRNAKQIQEIILNNPEANQDLENKMQEQGIDLQDDEARLDFILNNPDVVLNLNGLTESELASIKGLYGNVDVVRNQSSHSPSEILEAKDSDNFQSCYSLQPLSTIEKSLLTHFKHYSQLISV